MDTIGSANEGQRDRDEKRPQLMTAQEIAAFLRISPKTVYNWVSLGIIPCIRFNRRLVRFERKRVVEWLAQYEQKGRKRHKYVPGDASMGTGSPAR